MVTSLADPRCSDVTPRPPPPPLPLLLRPHFACDVLEIRNSRSYGNACASSSLTSSSFRLWRVGDTELEKLWKCLRLFLSYFVLISLAPPAHLLSRPPPLARAGSGKTLAFLLRDEAIELLAASRVPYLQHAAQVAARRWPSSCRPLCTSMRRCTVGGSAWVVRASALRGLGAGRAGERAGGWGWVG